MDENFKELIDTICLLKPQKSLVSESLFEILLAEVNRTIILDKDYDRSYEIFLLMKEICLNGSIDLANFLPVSLTSLNNMSNDHKEILYPIVGNFLLKNLHRLKTDDFVFVGVLKNIYDLSEDSQKTKVDELFSEYSIRVQSRFDDMVSKNPESDDHNDHNDRNDNKDDDNDDLSSDSDLFDSDSDSA